MLGFHLRKTDRLIELELFRTSYSDQTGSFEGFQSDFEKKFGKPTSESKGNECFPSYEWRLNGSRIVHYVFDRFGPEEHMRIQYG